MRILASLLAFSCLLMVGCGSSGTTVSGLVPAKGKINYGPYKVEPGKILFWSTFDGPNFEGMVDASGAFTLSLGAQPGAMPGKYKVTLAGKGAPKFLQNDKTTNIVAEVSASNPEISITVVAPKAAANGE
jgi:hypothetical protein